MQRMWGLLFGIVLLGCLILTAVSPAFGWWLPKGTSSYSRDIDILFYGILAVTTFFYVLTEAVLVYNMLAFIGPRKPQFTHGSSKLEAIWTAIPAVILILLAVWQINVWANIKYQSRILHSLENEDYLQMAVDMRQWEYRIRYASSKHMEEWQASRSSAVEDFKKRLPERLDDVHIPNDVHVWKGQKVLMHLRTRDVIHSVFFPNLRLKQDALPGRATPVWFEATEANVKYDSSKNEWLDGYRKDGSQWVADRANIFDLVCTQYCGTRHSLMRGKLFVHETKEDYLAWLKAQEKDQSPPRVAAAGN